jgi:hypothetical protein
LSWLDQFPRATEANLTLSAREHGQGHLSTAFYGDSGRLLRIKPDEIAQAEQDQPCGRYFRGPNQEDPVALDPEAAVQQIEIPVKMYVRPWSRALRLISLMCVHPSASRPFLCVSL